MKMGLSLPESIYVTLLAVAEMCSLFSQPNTKEKQRLSLSGGRECHPHERFSSFKAVKSKRISQRPPLCGNSLTLNNAETKAVCQICGCSCWLAVTLLQLSHLQWRLQTWASSVKGSQQDWPKRGNQYQLCVTQTVDEGSGTVGVKILASRIFMSQFCVLLWTSYLMILGPK